MDNTLDAKKQQVMKMLKNEVSKYTKDGSSLPQAISLTCKKLGLNPYNIIRQYFPEIKEEDIEGYTGIIVFPFKRIGNVIEQMKIYFSYL